MSDIHYESSQYELPADEQQHLQQGQGGAKRKRDSNADGGTQTRAKRNRYISIACNECKRRKIKCNGETPCQRCGNLKLDCVYEPNCCSGNLKHSNDFKQLESIVEHLQSQVEFLTQNLNQLRRSIGQEEFPEPAQYVQAQNGQHDDSGAMQAPPANMAIDPVLQSRRTKQGASPQQARFLGPSSPGFSLGVAQDSLNYMGIANGEDTTDQGLSTLLGVRNDSVTTQKTSPTIGDPIWSVTKDEAVRLCRVFEDENGLLYPFLDIERIIRHAKLLLQFVEAMSKNLVLANRAPIDTMQDEDTDVLKLVLAIALVTEGGGRSELGKRFFDFVNKDADTRLSGSANLKDIQILTLTAIYHFHSDDEGLAWRVIGLTARLCLELGLHRSETYNRKFPDENERTAAMKLFWSVYVLDHRWSMGTGMSFALQDDDLDQALPTPEQSSPYLATMIQYSRLGSRVWKTIASNDTSNTLNNVFSKEEASYLDFQVQQWYEGIPSNLRFAHPNTPDADRSNLDGGRPLYRLRALLYLRHNQMRITIYRSMLQSANSINSNGPSARKVVGLAKDTVRVLTHIHTSTDIYRTQQTTWNHFLLSALAVLALAVLHAPDQFVDSCREEFFMALELVRGLSADSYVSKRLWRTIRSLRELGPQLGSTPRPALGPSPVSTQVQLPQDRQTQNDAQRSAAMAMAGLATGQPVDETAFFATHAPGPGDLNSPITRNDQGGQFVTSPNGMANELTNLFEAAGATGNGSWSNAFQGDMSSTPGPLSSQGGLVGVDGRPLAYDSEEMSRILKELF